ncbi:MAG: leucine--tRNA ligase [Candidatus ainarchaeum sp.]|nr:leucine--tRNA ligase [Candidatus ainarchaeum sp.]MDD3976262.1 leucine--tRNA ligase [Candidatus ainarchaeum sp.]
MYDFLKFESKWQKRWKDEKIGEVNRDETKPKFFLIWAYLTVSGFHHVGHMRGYSYADAISRFKRMQGYNVLMPAGGHASGNSAVSKSIKILRNDLNIINYYKSMGFNDSDLNIMKNPEGFIDFFSKIYVQDYESYGFIGDWRRFTLTTNKDYNKFIEWQFKKLKEKDLLIQKPYFATACINCGPVAVDPSESDISKGGNAQKNEYTILKMKLVDKENTFVVVATLRPETVFGQTNLWIDYDLDYYYIKINNEIWIASKEFAEKLKYQKENIDILDTISGKELSGKYVIAPGVNRKIIILPSSFCDPNIGTGIVTSVPSDAPADWIGLYDLQNSKELCDRYNLSYDEIIKIKPIEIIKSKDFGTLPALKICKDYNITSQKDIDKLEKAKKEVYKKGFHTGIMLSSCGVYSGQKVEIAKENIKKDLIDNNLADLFFDLSEEVICRCGEKVVIKKIDDQWFIKYSDKDLTKKTINHSQEMLLLPEQYKKNIPNILNWFDDRACARQGNWLGTKFPFDKSYTIEPIADSTLYPIFYLVSLYTNKGILKTDNLTEEFFDYIFLDKGNLEDVSIKSDISIDILNNIKKDVEYWYPLDINLGGQDHLTVHFPVFLMNHVGILPKKFWPKGIIVNWWVINKSGKISKSKGGARSIGQEAKNYSVDAIRLFYANVASPFVNIDFPPEDLKKYKQRLEKIYYFIIEIIDNKDFLENKNYSNLDNWIISKFYKRLEKVICSMNNVELKEATDEIYFNFYNDLHWYFRRGGNNKLVLLEVITNWILTMGLFTPHLSEELNEIIGNKNLVAVSKFPEVILSKIDLKLDENEKAIENLISDIRNVSKMANQEKINKVILYISEKWKYEVYNLISDLFLETKNIGKIMSILSQKYPDKKKELGKIVPKVLKQPSLLEICYNQEEEYELYVSAKTFLEKEFNISFNILKAEDSLDIKAKGASPGKIGILIE